MAAAEDLRGPSITRSLILRHITRPTVAAVLLWTLIAHAVLAVAYVPVNSDLTVYQRYAAAVGMADQTGGSFSEARDDTIRRQAASDGRPEPSSDDLLVEYPPLAVAWMAVIASGLDPAELPGAASEAYTTRFRLAMFGLDVLMIVGLAIWILRQANPNDDRRDLAVRLAIYGLGTTILGNLLFDRLDLIIGGLLLLSTGLLVRGAWLWSFLVLALAINFKASPIALAPLWVVASMPADLFARGLERWRALGLTFAARSLTLALLSTLIFLPFVLAEGERAFDFLRFRVLQGVQIESIPASVLLLLQAAGLPLEVTSTFGAYEAATPLSGAIAAMSPVLIVVAAAFVVAVFARPASAGMAGSRPLATSFPSVFVTATVATILLTLVTSKALSPQYVLWLLPLIPLVDLGADRTRAFQFTTLAVCVVTTAIFPYLYGRTLVRQDPASDGYLDPSPIGIALVVLRNALLLWLAWRATAALFGATGWRSRLPLSSSTTSGI